MGDTWLPLKAEGLCHPLHAHPPLLNVQWTPLAGGWRRLKQNNITAGSQKTLFRGGGEGDA